MKTLLFALILTLAPALDAQPRELLYMCDTVYSDIGKVDGIAGGSDGENGSAVSLKGHYPKIAWCLFYLPSKRPDSITFVLKNTAPVQLWVVQDIQNWFHRIGCAPANSQFREVTVPYSDAGKPNIAYAGVGMLDCQYTSLDTNKYVLIDAVYAVWREPALVREQQPDHKRAWWYDMLGNRAFHGSLEELSNSEIRGTYISTLGKYTRTK